MADVPKKLYQGQPGTSDTLLYTAPATGCIVRQVHVVNTSGTTRTVTLGFNTGAAIVAAEHFLSALSLAPSQSYDWTGYVVLDASETIRGLQENATACTFQIHGVEI